ncbi:MAG: ribulose-phosphate 3-epimerase [Chloroflexi bacterium]|nr:ribulose-phosphate 3-epimerase [Chloroflexota bacterium]
MGPKPCRLAPSILSADFTRLGAQIAECEAAGADWIHVDVMDGHFVPNLTMGPFIVEACRRSTRLPLDVHLMVERPEGLLEAFARAGASILTVHIETCLQPGETLRCIRALGCRAGLTLNPSTPVEAVAPFLSFVDLALVMTVQPGYSSQAFMPEMLPKIAGLRALLDEQAPGADLEVDGGLSRATLPGVREAGANVFVAASSVFKHPAGIGAGLAALKEACAG